MPAYTQALAGWSQSPVRAPALIAGARGRVDGPVRAVCRSRGGRGGRGGRPDLRIQSTHIITINMPASNQALDGWSQSPVRAPALIAGARGRVDGPVRAHCRSRGGRGGLEDLCTALSDTSFTASSPGEIAAVSNFDRRRRSTRDFLSSICLRAGVGRPSYAAHSYWSPLSLQRPPSSIILGTRGLESLH